MAFRIEPIFRMPRTLRVLDRPGEARAVALVDLGEDGSATLFPVERDRPPAPLTGETQTFADLDALRTFLGIQPEALAA
jgi:hypothetical protein